MPLWKNVLEEKGTSKADPQEKGIWAKKGECFLMHL